MHALNTNFTLHTIHWLGCKSKVIDIRLQCSSKWPVQVSGCSSHNINDIEGSKFTMCYVHRNLQEENIYFSEDRNFEWIVNMKAHNNAMENWIRMCIQSRLICGTGSETINQLFRRALSRIILYEMRINYSIYVLSIFYVSCGLLYVHIHCCAKVACHLFFTIHVKAYNLQNA